MKFLRSGVKCIELGMTPDGFELSAEVNRLGQVRIVKARDAPIDRSVQQPDEIILFPRRQPIVRQLLYPGHVSAGNNHALAEYLYFTFDPSEHCAGLEQATTDMIMKARYAGWSQKEQRLLSLICTRHTSPHVNIPQGSDKYKRTVSLGLTETGYSLDANKFLGGVSIVQRRNELVDRFPGHPDVQVFDSVGLHAYNEVCVNGMPVYRVAVTPNPELFLETLGDHGDELEALAEGQLLWTYKDLLRLRRLSDKFFDEVGELIGAPDIEAFVRDL